MSLEPKENALRMKKKVEHWPDRILDVRYPEKVERRLDRISDVIRPGGMAAGEEFRMRDVRVECRRGKNSGCEIPGWNGGGEEFWMRDIRGRWKVDRVEFRV